jgi:hypothetical protein
MSAVEGGTDINSDPAAVSTTTHVKSAIVLSLMIEASGSFGCQISAGCGRSGSVVPSAH